MPFCRRRRRTVSRMNPDRCGARRPPFARCPEEYLAVTPEVVAVVDNGHSFHRGMHVGWAWAEDRRGWFLDFLSEHRMAGMSAERFTQTGPLSTWRRLPRCIR